MSRLTGRQRAAAAALVTVAVVFCVLDLAGAPLAGAHDGVRGTFGALYRGTDAVLGPARRFLGGIGGDGSGGDEALRRQNADLQQRNARLQQQIADTGQLAALQQLGTSLGSDVRPARVVALGPGQGFEWTATISLGRDEGVGVDQTVVAGDALVGRVLEADATTSVVLLAADPGGGVGVRLERTGQLGVVTGRGAAGMSLAPLDPGAQLQVGDVLRTGPVGATTFVAGLRVGTVTAVSRHVDGSVSATVAPAVSATGLDLVGVVMTLPPGDRAASR